jgi:hypothetical protein
MLIELYQEILFKLEDENIHGLNAIVTWVLGMSEYFAVVKEWWEGGLELVNGTKVWVREKDFRTGKWLWYELKVTVTTEPTGRTREGMH